MENILDVVADEEEEEKSECSFIALQRDKRVHILLLPSLPYLSISLSMSVYLFIAKRSVPFCCASISLSFYLHHAHVDVFLLLLSARIDFVRLSMCVCVCVHECFFRKKSEREKNTEIS
jgi:hypothetical protein